nr:hypothetical protein [Parvularcula sp. IMCC14364]
MIRGDQFAAPSGNTLAKREHCHGFRCDHLPLPTPCLFCHLASPKNMCVRRTSDFSHRFIEIKISQGNSKHIATYARSRLE